MLALVRSWIAKPIEFYSCFISYSHADREFARLLYDTLQGRGVRCWLRISLISPLWFAGIRHPVSRVFAAFSEAAAAADAGRQFIP
jgi:hypothetical protein